MADSIQLQSDHDEFNTLMKDMHDSLRVSFSKPTQIEACSETYFDTSELDSFGLFNGDLRTVEQLPEETLSGLPFRAPTSSSSSSSNPSIAYQSDVSKQVASTDLRESAYTLPFRPADVPQWRFEQPQHHVQRALPPFDMTPLGTTYMGPNGLLIQTPSTTPSPEPTYSVDHDQSLGEDLNLPTYNPWEMNVPFNASGFPHPATKQSMDEDTATDGDDEPINIVDGIDLSYAKELERCLRRMPEYTLPLKDIYAWIKENTNKVKDPQSRGWQNSVRHNLSLNEGFEKVPIPGQGAKRGGTGLWRLTREALIHGVQSTTKFRKEAANKSRRKNESPSPQRQASGQKGGLATRENNRKRKQQARVKQATSAPNPYLGHQQMNLDGTLYGSPYSLASSESSPAFSPVPTPDLPLWHPHEVNHGTTMPVTQDYPQVTTYSAGYGPVHSAIGEYPMRYHDPTNVGLFRHYEPVSSPFSITTPEMTEDSNGSCYCTPSSREQSVQA